MHSQVRDLGKVVKWCLKKLGNWAQLGGRLNTRIAVNRPTPWSARWGHGLAALDYTEEYVRSSGRKARLFVIGGDDQVQTSELAEEDLRPYPGGGGYKNDVWSTTGYGRWTSICGVDFTWY